MSKILVTLNIDDEQIKKVNGREDLEEAICRELDWLTPSGISVEGWSFLDRTQQSFIYTFGSSDSFPHHGGWVEVQAQDRATADEIFRSRYPDRTPGTLNCASIYTQEEFQSIWDKYYKGTDWDVCHQILQSPSHNQQLREAVLLSCIHEHEYGNTWYTSIHATEEEARVYAEIVREKANVEDDRGEFFNVNTERITVDISKLKSIFPPEQAKPLLADQIN